MSAPVERINLAMDHLNGTTDQLIRQTTVTERVRESSLVGNSTHAHVNDDCFFTFKNGTVLDGSTALIVEPVIESNVKTTKTYYDEHRGTFWVPSTDQL